MTSKTRGTRSERRPTGRGRKIRTPRTRKAAEHCALLDRDDLPSQHGGGTFDTTQTMDVGEFGDPGDLAPDAVTHPIIGEGGPPSDEEAIALGTNVPKLSGFSANGQRFIKLEHGARRIAKPLGFFTKTQQHVIEKLASENVVILAKADRQQLMREAAAIVDFPDAPVAFAPGWCNSSFIMPDGEVFSPDDTVLPEILFAVDPNRCHRSGSLARWKTQVAQPLASYPIPAFVIMLGFVPPLLAQVDRTDNFSFEITGREGRGKTLALRLASSVIGAPDGAYRYCLPFDTTRGGIESIIQGHADLPLYMDETNTAGSGAGQRAQASAMMDFAFQVASGQGRSRLNAVSRQNVRTIALITSNESTAELNAGKPKSVLNATTDRLIPLNVYAEGVINGSPAGYADIASFANELMRQARLNHGLAFRKFVKKLVHARHSDSADLASFIRNGIERFRRLAGVSANDGSACRVADAFGIPMVAGELAKRFHALPRTFNCDQVALDCYNNSQGRREVSSYAQQIVSLAKDPRVIELDSSNLPALTNAAMENTIAFLHRPLKRRPQLLFWPSAFRRQFPDFSQLLRDQDVANMVMKEGDRYTVKRAIRSSGPVKDRVYAFELPHGTV